AAMYNILLTTSASVERRLKRTMVCIYYEICISFEPFCVEGWTYYWTDNKTMSWNETRKWCQNHYTDIVMVHNENVTRFLKENVKNRTSPYYWIGMQKINGTWMWVANGQIMKYQNWATNEPNNNKSNENCVELYTSKTNNNGKWNDDNCQLAKYPLLHHLLTNGSSAVNGCSQKENSIT
uniref:C-type lectin domain-containing protein n=1 Tax=Sinocyclocheilus grahami TaxID=75366 RepID=A0A672P6P9_SINGR